jgi:hypothetical protein
MHPASISKPFDIQGIDAATLASNCRVIAVLAVPKALDAAIEKFYGD